MSARAAELTDLARARLGEMSPRQQRQGLELLAARLEDRRPRAVVGRRWMALGFSAAAVVALVGGARLLTGSSRSAPLAYRVDGGELLPGGYLRARPGIRPTVRFADGTVVSLREGTRGQLTELDAHGARISFDDGEARVDVVPRPASRWLFDAGPFSITVRGTAFTVSWSGADERLDVRLDRGLINVSGPTVDTPITLRAGHRLVINLRDADRGIAIRPIDAPADEPAAAPPAPSAKPSFEAPRPRLPRQRRGSVAAPAPGQSWTVALGRGEFASILDEASRRGIEATLAERSSEDLAALADAARYTRRIALARRALQAQRRRFSETLRARDAAFLLGRLEEEGTAGVEPALRWYDRYLEEAPSGTYASEALGRKLTAIERLHGRDRARPVAEEYLRRYPRGTYAQAARALVGTP